MDSNTRLQPTSKTSKALWARTGNACAKCKTFITEDTSNGSVSILGEICHIVAVRPGEARYDESLTAEQKRELSNLIILCGTCHKIIDDDEDKYPSDYLRNLKVHHEKWFMDSLREHMPEITFKELEIITQHLFSLQVSSDDYVLIPPVEKIRKNGLSNEVAQLLRLGTAQSNLVRDYLQAHTTTGFDERLKSGFVNKYKELKALEMSPDEIFYEMKKFATSNSTEFRMVAAGLAVVSYFFEHCDIFEK